MLGNFICLSLLGNDNREELIKKYFFAKKVSFHEYSKLLWNHSDDKILNKLRNKISKKIANANASVDISKNRLIKSKERESTFTLAVITVLISEQLKKLLE